METEVVHTTRKVSQFYFFPYFELFCIIDIFPVQIIALSRNVMLMVHRELGLPVVYHNGYHFQQEIKITTTMVVTVLCSVNQPGDINTVYPEWYLSSRTIHGLRRCFLVSLETKLFFGKKS